MSAPVLVDLFSGAGGAARGYARAGWRVVAVDSLARRLHHHPSSDQFCGDWRDGMAWALERFDVAAWHASPPCQSYSITRHSHHVEHPQLVDPVRAALVETGMPYVIENVPGAPLLDPLTLCGTQFDLTADDTDGRPLFLRRHRLFESNMPLMAPGTPCRCRDFKARGIKCAGAYGGGSQDRQHAEHVRRGGYTPPKAVRAALLGLPDTLPMDALSQSIPPAYTEHIGAQLLAQLPAATAA